MIDDVDLQAVNLEEQPFEVVMSVTASERVIGCLLAGACGDALGAPWEFTSHIEMIMDSGPRGISEFWTDGGVAGAVTDETQLTLFTVAGLITSRTDRTSHQTEHLQQAYLSWLTTQSLQPSRSPKGQRYGDLAEIVRAQGDRCPDADTVEALRLIGEGRPIAFNRHQSNGAAARSAPFGLLHSQDPRLAYQSAAHAAQITHGHSRGFIAAGAFAMLVAWLMKGRSMVYAVEQTLIFLQTQPDNPPTSIAIENAPWSLHHYEARPYWMGFGWSADEALAIAVNAVLTTDNLQSAIVVAASHDGDSDTTASMAGNLAGALYGIKAIPPRWLNKVEMRRDISKLGRQLCKYIPECSRSR